MCELRLDGEPDLEEWGACTVHRYMFQLECECEGECLDGESDLEEWGVYCP